MDLEIFAAKSDRLDAEKWLPFHAHAWDTAEIMERLLCQWLPDKIALGHSRTMVYLANWIVCNAGVFLTYFIYVVVSFIGGYFLTNGYLTSFSAMCGDLFIHKTERLRFETRSNTKNSG